MAKIGTAHIEVKPVVDDAVLEAIAERIANAVAEGVELGMARANRKGNGSSTAQHRPIVAWRDGKRFVMDKE